MRLYRLIGLEIEALMAEHEQTMKNISEYEDILNNYDSMARVIVKDLDQIKREYASPRRTAIENVEEVVYEEKKPEAVEVCFLMDRFGYMKLIDKGCLRTEQGSGGRRIPVCLPLHEQRPDLHLHGQRKDAHCKSRGHPHGTVP